MPENLKLSSRLFLLASLALLTIALFNNTYNVLDFAFAQNTKQAGISFSPQVYDFGKVDEGIEVHGLIKIKNNGKEKLLIKSATSTCGCTVSKLKSNEILPGQSIGLEIMMDTALKQGLVKKEIKVVSNDPQMPEALVYVQARVSDPHKSMGKAGKAKIFLGRCAVCHVDQGKGKRGEGLYLADCSMCHGMNLEGAVGPALVPIKFSNPKIAKKIEDTICFGSKYHRSMPGFLKDAGGPLDRDEINSLISYLKWRSSISAE